ncbi:hypothetical protein AQPW35_54440 [Rubrivivax pictus]|uniref:Uncharacterized protein n=1 Tax=Pseudaquabacterium pictum TaxID=2315236 RepID=A0A480AYD1_9BURK|nr:hypothetical protein AQPW35_54440 [Rubrivivax pictus]
MREFKDYFREVGEASSRSRAVDLLADEFASEDRTHFLGFCYTSAGQTHCVKWSELTEDERLRLT